MITFLTIIIAFVCLLLMTIILIQDPKTGQIDSNFGRSEVNSLMSQGKSTLILEKATWGIASILFVLCIITAVLA